MLNRATIIAIASLLAIEAVSLLFIIRFEFVGYFLLIQLLAILSATHTLFSSKKNWARKYLLIWIHVLYLLPVLFFLIFALPIILGHNQLISLPGLNEGILFHLIKMSVIYVGVMGALFHDRFHGPWL